MQSNQVGDQRRKVVLEELVPKGSLLIFRVFLESSKLSLSFQSFFIQTHDVLGALGRLGVDRLLEKFGLKHVALYTHLLGEIFDVVQKSVVESAGSFGAPGFFFLLLFDQELSVIQRVLNLKIQSDPCLVIFSCLDLIVLRLDFTKDRLQLLSLQRDRPSVKSHFVSGLRRLLALHDGHANLLEDLFARITYISKIMSRDRPRQRACALSHEGVQLAATLLVYCLLQFVFDFQEGLVNKFSFHK